MMREATQKRLLSILEGDLKAVNAKINADPFKAWQEANQHIVELLPEIAKPKGQKHYENTTRKLADLQRKRDRAWRAQKAQMKSWEKWYDEQFAIEKEINYLKLIFSRATTYPFSE